jgi:hypothetical protein
VNTYKRDKLDEFRATGVPNDPYGPLIDARERELKAVSLPVMVVVVVVLSLLLWGAIWLGVKVIVDHLPGMIHI